jgi:hypothetical protein
MVQSKAKTVPEYLASLPPERRAVVEALRKTIRANLDAAYEEGMQYGMIGYYVPHRVFPAGYHCDPKQPLPFAGLAAQKNHFGLYICSVYYSCDGNESPEATWLRDAWTRTGKKLDMGKACIRFKKLDDVPLEVVGEAIRRMPAKRYVEFYESALAAMAAAKPARAAKKTAAKKVAKKVATKSAKKAPKKPARR